MVWHHHTPIIVPCHPLNQFGFPWCLTNSQKSSSINYRNRNKNKCLFLGFIFSKKREKVTSGRTNGPKALWICNVLMSFSKEMHSLLQMCLAAVNFKQTLDTTRKKKKGRKKSQAWEIKRKKFKNMQNTSC